MSGIPVGIFKYLQVSLCSWLNTFRVSCPFDSDNSVILPKAKGISDLVSTKWNPLEFGAQSSPAWIYKTIAYAII